MCAGGTASHHWCDGQGKQKDLAGRGEQGKANGLRNHFGWNADPRERGGGGAQLLCEGVRVSSQILLASLSLSGHHSFITQSCSHPQELHLTPGSSWIMLYPTSFVLWSLESAMTMGTQSS